MPKHSISKDMVRYVVNKEQKKVVAYIEGTQNLFLDFIYDNYAPWFCALNDRKMIDQLRMPNKFTGIATCGPDDEWDEEFGKLLAFDRMKTALTQSFFKRANTYVNQMEKGLDDFCDIVNAYGEKLEKNTIRRKELIDNILSSRE